MNWNIDIFLLYHQDLHLRKEIDPNRPKAGREIQGNLEQQTCMNFKKYSRKKLQQSFGPFEINASSKMDYVKANFLHAL